MSPDNPHYLRFAYADPPYPGQAKRHYGTHADYAGEVDHAELVARLNTYDGWALSTSAVRMASVLRLCPDDVRVAVWHVKNSEPPGNLGRWWWSWEPVIIRAPDLSRRGPMVRNILSAHAPKGFFGNTVTGQKPEAFCRWVFALLGAGDGDSLEDLYPGSGAVTEAWDRYVAQGTLL